MQPRDRATHRSALFATGVAVVLCLAAAFGVWALATAPSTTQAGLPVSPTAAAAAGGGPAVATPRGAAPRPVQPSTADPTDLDALVASEDAAGQTPGQHPTTKSASFVGEVGTYLVGRGIPPGTYESAGGHDGRTCQWSRLKGLAGIPADVLASGSTDAPARVTILASDAFFQTKDCATWHKTAA
ncbi:hypothetical protein [Terrabacter sp. 2RAF25]|uniref:hypothetical protein n=1 Tax=Terrabacter sp. 2RAF25 TaxID=3232998 RepID=UPI003F9AA2B3